ncbi:hypothetical protein ABMA28_003522 [Loxostege sticticalis]|uniref:Uncharacterized protein n=1 Tax=Loxostege sticticalis TaxID=481309 RepID=A0ABD0T0Q5_LOXSC
MEVPLKKKAYSQKYRPEWEVMEEFKNWLRPVSNDQNKAICLLCHTEMFAKLADLSRHAETKKHKNKCEAVSKNRQICFEGVPKENFSRCRKAQGKLALFITEHSSISTIDHLTDLCKDIFPDSKAVIDLKLHRTKCTQVINQVLAPHFKEELLKDIGTQKYSIILDESTDISVTKFKGIIVRYFSLTLNAVVSAFLSLEPVDKADANGLATSLVKCLSSNNLPIANLVGVGTDNAAVMTGQHNSVYEILRTQYNLPNLILIRCVCHSLQLAVSRASEQTIPKHIEFLIRETYKWFALSAKRQKEYAEIYNLINCGKQPLKILKLCDTRWLSIEPAVARILNQWEELKVHFELTKDKCYTSDVLSRENTDPVKLLSSLMNLFRSVVTRVLIPNAAVTDKDFLNVNVRNRLNPVPYLGYLFENHAQRVNIPPEKLAGIRRSCIEFTIQLAIQIQNRLPTNYTALEKMALLSKENTLKQVKDNTITVLAKEFGFHDEKVDKILTQWHGIQYIRWENSSDDTVKFWAQVSRYKNAAGFNAFQDLVDLAITALLLPHSNAEVERVFSVMNIVKSKIRNRMSAVTLNSILLIRHQMRLLKKTCHTYELPMNVLNKITKTIKKGTSAGESTSQTLTPEIPENNDETDHENVTELLNMVDFNN